VAALRGEDHALGRADPPEVEGPHRPAGGRDVPQPRRAVPAGRGRQLPARLKGRLRLARLYETAGEWKKAEGQWRLLLEA
jgi:hypothetical protein